MKTDGHRFSQIRSDYFKGEHYVEVMFQPIGAGIMPPLALSPEEAIAIGHRLIAAATEAMTSQRHLKDKLADEAALKGAK